jgi:putative membrane protein
MGFGFVVARFGLFMREMAAVEHIQPHHASGLSFWVGTAMLLLGVAVNALAAAQHVSTINRLKRNDPWELKTSALGLAVVIILVATGVTLVAYLVITTP